MAVVFDFDQSMVDDNTDTVVPGVLAADMLEYIRDRSRTVQWTALMADVATQLSRRGFGRADIERALMTTPVQEGVWDSVRLAKARGLRVYIVSDANEVYINTILEGHGVRGLIDGVHTNPARFVPVAAAAATVSIAAADGSGGIVASASAATELLLIEPFVPATTPHGCPLCPVNMCKGAILDAMGLSKPRHPATSGGGDDSGNADSGSVGGAAAAPTAASSDASSSFAAAAAAAPPRVLYVGDGGGDFCPCLRLGSGDVACARADYPLHQKLLAASASASAAGSVRAAVKPWSTGKQLYAHIAAFVEEVAPAAATAAAAAATADGTS